MKIGDTFWLTVLVQIQTLIILVAVILFMLVPRAGRKDYLGLGLMMWLALLTEIVAAIGHHALHKNMNVASNIFCILYLPLGLLFYQRRIEGLTMNIVIGISLAYATMGLLNFFFFQGLHGLNSYTSTVLHIGFMCLSVSYFAALFFQHSVHHTVRGMFWINAAILIYSAGTFFIHLLVNYLVKFLNNDLIVVWMIHHSIGLVYYGLIAYGLNKVRKEYLSRIFAI